MNTERHDGSLWVEAYSLCELVLAVQENVKAGYEVSLTNSDYPQGFSGHFTVGMVKNEVLPVLVGGASEGVQPQRTDAPDAQNTEVKLAVMQTPPTATESPVMPVKAASRGKTRQSV